MQKYSHQVYISHFATLEQTFFQFHLLHILFINLESAGFIIIHPLYSDTYEGNSVQPNALKKWKTV